MDALKALSGQLIWIDCADACVREACVAAMADELASAGLEALQAASPTPAATQRVAEACAHDREGCVCLVVSLPVCSLG